VSTLATSPKPGERATANGSGSRLPDPVGELRFMVTVDDDTRIGAFSECSGLSAEYEVMEYQEGGENQFVYKLRGRVKYPNLVLKRGVTHEAHFLEWFLAVKNRDDRGAVTVTLVGDDGKKIRSWSFAGAFPVKWQGPTLSAKSTSVAIETLEIAHEGFVVGA
jgi:phage tail-like protein